MGTRHTDACLFQDDEVSHAVVIQRPRRSDPRYASSQDHDFGVKVLAGLAARDSANRQQEVNCSQSHFSSELYGRSRPLVSGIAAAQNLLPKMFRWRKRTYVRACANAIVTWYWCSASQSHPFLAARPNTPCSEYRPDPQFIFIAQTPVYSGTPLKGHP